MHSVPDVTTESSWADKSPLEKEIFHIHDPELKGDTGLVVVSGAAEDIGDVSVRDREARLTELGIPLELINSTGEKVCDSCYDKITGADPGEIINYRRLIFADRFWGEKCKACQIQ